MPMSKQFTLEQRSANCTLTEEGYSETTIADRLRRNSKIKK